MVSENSELLLNTILSRLQILKTTNYSSNEKIEILQNKFPEKGIIKLEKSLIYSDDNLGDSIHVLESDIITDDNFDDFQMWMRLCYSANIQEIVKWVNERTKKGRRSQSIFLKYSLKMVRNCLILHFSDPNTLTVTENEKKFLSKFYPFIHEENISEISQKIEECIKNIERNANSKIIFYELSLQLMILLKVNRKFVE